MSSILDNRTSSVRDIATTLFAPEKRFGAKQSDLVSGAALNTCLGVHQAFEVLNTPAEQRVSILASNVFCADTPLGTVAKQTIGAAIRKYKETKPLPAIPRPLVHPDEPTPDELAIINYRNQLQRESNKVAMRQYNYELYKAALRFVVAKYVPFSAAMRLKTDWDCMHKY